MNVTGTKHTNLSRLLDLLNFASWWCTWLHHSQRQTDILVVRINSFIKQNDNLKWFLKTTLKHRPVLVCHQCTAFEKWLVFMLCWSPCPHETEAVIDKNTSWLLYRYLLLWLDLCISYLQLFFLLHDSHLNSSFEPLVVSQVPLFRILQSPVYL